MSGWEKAVRYSAVLFVCVPVCVCIMPTNPASAQATSANALSLSCTAPVTVGVPSPGASGSGKVAERIAIEPTQVDVRLFSLNETTTLVIRNESSTAVSAIHLSFPELLDGKSYRRIGPVQWDAKITPGLQTNQRTDCTFALPEFRYAGTYSGVLRVASGDREIPVPITLRARGPILWSWYGLPLFLAIITVLLGWFVSLILDQWYTKGLPRVQVVLSLRNQRTATANFASQLAAWEKAKNVSANSAELTAAFDNSEIDTALKDASNLTINDLQQLSTRFALATRLNDEFWTALQIADLKVPPANLAQTVQHLDAVARTADVVAYRTSLFQALTAPLPAVAPVGPAPAAVPASLHGIDLSGVSSASLRQRIVVMDVVKWFVLALLVLFTAYTVYYLPNPAFGSLQDYLALFIWALGLSTTGSQLVSSIHK